jgi:hypothetical protein
MQGPIVRSGPVVPTMADPVARARRPAGLAPATRKVVPDAPVIRGVPATRTDAAGAPPGAAGPRRLHVTAAALDRTVGAAQRVDLDVRTTTLLVTPAARAVTIEARLAPMHVAGDPTVTVTAVGAPPVPARTVAGTRLAEGPAVSVSVPTSARSLVTPRARTCPRTCRSRSWTALRAVGCAP